MMNSRMLLVLLLPGLGLAQELLPDSLLRFNPSALELGERSLGIVDTGVWLVNDWQEDLPLESAHGLSGRVEPGVLPAALAAGDSVWLELRMDLRDDLDLRDALVVESPSLRGLPALALAAQPRHENPDYTGAANLWGNALKTFLAAQVSGHTVYSYSEARTHMFGDYDNVNGEVQCVYTATWVATTGIPDGNVMNCEHTWPQSMGAEGDARSDMHHLYPTLSSPNSIRGNLPFGEVVNQNWAQGGSLRGTDSNGTTVFEPRDPHKGDCARACYYFALRYGNLSGFLGYQEATLRAWAVADTVSQKELDRNDAIDALQHNRNPFIDHMGWMNRIASLSGSADPQPTRLLQLPVDSLALGTVAPGDTVRINLPMLNTGNQNLLIGYLQSSMPEDLSIRSHPTSLGAGQPGWVELAFHPRGTEDLLVDLVLSSNAQNGFLRHVYFNGTGGELAVDPISPTHPIAWTILGVAPNPFNPSTRVSLHLEHPADLMLNIYDTRGALVYTGLESLPAGESSLALDLSNRPSGRYWLQVTDGRSAETVALTLVK